MKDELEWLRELEQDAQTAWKECPFENWLLVRSKISNRIIELLEARTGGKVHAPFSYGPGPLNESRYLTRYIHMPRLRAAFAAIRAANGNNYKENVRCP